MIEIKIKETEYPTNFNNDSYEFCGTRYYKGNPIVTAWGHTADEVYNQIKS